MVEQVLSKARHYLMRFHRPAELKLERVAWVFDQTARVTAGWRVFFVYFRISEVNGMDAGSQRPDKPGKPECGGHQGRPCVCPG